MKEKYVIINLENKVLCLGQDKKLYWGDDPKSEEALILPTNNMDKARYQVTEIDKDFGYDWVVEELDEDGKIIHSHSGVLEKLRIVRKMKEQPEFYCLVEDDVDGEKKYRRYFCNDEFPGWHRRSDFCEGEEMPAFITPFNNPEEIKLHLDILNFTDLYDDGVWENEIKEISALLDLTGGREGSCVIGKAVGVTRFGVEDVVLQGDLISVDIPKGCELDEKLSTETKLVFRKK